MRFSHKMPERSRQGADRTGYGKAGGCLSMKEQGAVGPKVLWHHFFYIKFSKVLDFYMVYYRFNIQKPLYCKINRGEKVGKNLIIKYYSPPIISPVVVSTKYVKLCS